MNQNQNYSRVDFFSTFNGKRSSLERLIKSAKFLYIDIAYFIGKKGVYLAVIT